MEGGGRKALLGGLEQVWDTGITMQGHGKTLQEGRDWKQRPEGESCF